MKIKKDFMLSLMESIENSWPITIDKTGDLSANLLDLGLDSLDVSSLILSVEERFSVTITDDELEAINSINDIATIVHKKLS